MKNIIPIEILEHWLTLYLNPQVKSIGVNAKNATTMSSVGIEISLAPEYNEDFHPSPEKDLTIGGLSDSTLANILQSEASKLFIESFEAIPNTNTNYDFSKIIADNPPVGIYLCPQIAHFKYSDQQILFKFKKFNMFFSKKVFHDFLIVSQFLFYKAKFLEYDLLHKQDKPNGEVVILKKYEEKYFNFLLNALSKVLVEEDPVTSGGKKKK